MTGYLTLEELEQLIDERARAVTREMLDERDASLTRFTDQIRSSYAAAVLTKRPELPLQTHDGGDDRRDRVVGGDRPSTISKIAELLEQGLRDRQSVGVPHRVVESSHDFPSRSGEGSVEAEGLTSSEASPSAGGAR